MGFFDRISGGGGIPDEKVSNVQITPVGVEKLDKGLATGREFDVLVIVKKNQPASLEEVSRDLGLAPNKARYHINNLIHKRWLQKI